jgi:hypothetical protein
MTPQERAKAAIAELKSTMFGYRIRPHSPRWNRAMAHLNAIVTGEAPPPPPSPVVRCAPRTYNLGGGNQDPRFCVQAPGVAQIGPDHYRDEGGSEYNGDGLNTGGVWRDRNRIVMGLKPADQMDGRAACEPYGSFPPWPAGSYEL